MKEDMNKVCEQLDSLFLNSLDLIEEKVVTTIQLENHLRDGHLEMAKSRYIRGKESVGLLRIPQDTEITSLFDLETTYQEEEHEDEPNNVPRFSINLKNKEELKNIQDPLKWFGVLVPQSLKTAQKRFQESLYLAARISDIGAKLNVILNEVEAKKKIKSKLSAQGNEE